MVQQGFEMLFVFFHRWFWLQICIVFYTLQLVIFAVLLSLLLLLRCFFALVVVIAVVAFAVAGDSSTCRKTLLKTN